MTVKNGDILNGRYRIVQQQAAGGMAVVYKAIDQALGRTVAVKILRPNLLANDPAFLSRFQNEARNVANLKHPNIVTVHDIGNDGSWHYIVMEFVEGQDLKKLIKSVGVLPVARALNLAVQICAGIGFAHRAGLVHADVKPQNILVTGDDVVKVTDFGIAQALTESKPGERMSVVWGSPHYFAPEQARGEKPTPAADVYSIGIVMYEMLTGALPYSGTNQQELALAHIRDPIPMVTDSQPAIPASLAQIVYKMMSKDPSARYRSAEQVMHVLATYRDKGIDTTTAAGLGTPAPLPVNTTPGTAPTVRPPDWAAQTQMPGTFTTRPAQGAPGAPMIIQPEPVPTQRVDLAPNSPYAPPPGRMPPSVAPIMPGAVPGGYPGTPSPFGSAQGVPPGVNPGMGQMGVPYPSQPMPPVEEPGGLDVITLILAGIAFFSVACLIPLYIAVFQAQFGG